MEIELWRKPTGGVILPSDVSPSHPPTLCPQMGTSSGPDILSSPWIKAPASRGIHGSCTEATVSALGWDREEGSAGLGLT